MLVRDDEGDVRGLVLVLVIVRDREVAHAVLDDDLLDGRGREGSAGSAPGRGVSRWSMSHGRALTLRGRRRLRTTKALLAICSGVWPADVHACS